MEKGRLIEIIRCFGDGLCAGCASYGDNSLTCEECQVEAIEEVVKIITESKEK